VSETTTHAHELEKKAPLVIVASRENRQYEFRFPEGVFYSELADVLQQMRDHVVFTARQEQNKLLSIKENDSMVITNHHES
jgi:hypothetical protein